MFNHQGSFCGVWKFSFFALVFILSLIVLTFSACRTTRHVSHPESDSGKFTKYNIHAQQTRRDIKASYAGYVDSGDGHFFIPAGSKILLPGTGYRYRNGFWFTVANTGQRVFFEFHKGRMGMSEPEYIALITTDTPVSLDHFSEIDRKGIDAGKVYTGMTKEGVLTAMGYPAKHRTPTLESNRWTYWRNRFVTMVVEFDGNGIVRSVIQ